MEDIKLNPLEGVGAAQVVISSEVNEGLDVSEVYVVHDAGDKAIDEITVNQEGKRVRLKVKTEDGSGYQEVALSDGSIVNVLKEKYAI